MRHRQRVARGFTLIELLVVLTLLAILAAIVVRPFGGSTEDARVTALRANLAKLRNAVELYYQEHNNTFPGAVSAADGTTPVANSQDGARAFVAQLTQYTDKHGKASATRDPAFRFGPYIKTSSLPPNPLALNEAGNRNVAVDITTADITAAAPDPTPRDNTGWKFYAKTGRLIANDGQSLSDGTATRDL